LNIINQLTRIDANERPNSLEKIISDSFFDSVRSMVDDVALNGKNAKKTFLDLYKNIQLDALDKLNARSDASDLSARRKQCPYD
jgi:hypothetical protein